MVFFNVFKEYTVKLVNIGKLYKMSGGHLGQPPQEYMSLTHETIAANAIDLLNLNHQQILNNVIPFDIFPFK